MKKQPTGLDRHKRDTVLVKILQDDIKTAKYCLKQQEKVLKELQKDEFSLFLKDKISNVSHVVGYFVGHIATLENVLHMLTCTGEELFMAIKESKVIEDENERKIKQLYQDIMVKHA